MELLFLRHGVAEARETWTGDDRARPLTPQGRKAMARAAKSFAELGLAPELIVTSPLARARQTAEIAAAGLGLSDRLVEDERLAPGFDAAGLADVIAGRGVTGAVMLVGHEPDFSETIAALIGGGRVVCKKGGLARVDVDASLRGGELVWLLPPRDLARRGKGAASAPGGA
jgi:phosphohistidine phosphatase